MLRKSCKKVLCFVIALLLCCPAAFPATSENLNGEAAVSNETEKAQNTEILQNKEKTFSKEEILLNMAVLHCGGESYKEAVSHLENSLNASKTVTVIDTRSTPSLEELSEYDCIFPDESIMTGFDSEGIRNTLTEYVRKGGSLFLSNGFCDWFSKDFLGISAHVKLEDVPSNLVNEAKGTDLEKCGEIICDFEKLYKNYDNYDYLKTLDYGYGFVTSSAQPVVKANGTTIYAVNKFGYGNVFITNPLLPNVFSINSFDRTQVTLTQQPFAGSSAGANVLLKSYFASYISKQKYGFSLERTFGSYGTTPIAWQLHYEEITGFENGASTIFSEICEKYNQVPSFTLIRNTYKWFSKYETISYLDIENNICTMDFYEGAYSGGKKVASENGFVSLVEAENTGSYFVDLDSSKERLFQSIIDVNNDGLSDIVCGSSDGKLYVYETIGFDTRWKCKDPKILKATDKSEISVGSYSAPSCFDFDGDGLWDIVTGNSEGKIYFVKNLGNGYFEKPVYVASIPDGEAMPTIGDIDNDGVNELVVGSNKGRIYSFEIENNNLSDMKLVCEFGNEKFVSPLVTSLDSDSFNDLLVGTYDGYIARLLGTHDGTFKHSGYVMANEENYKGNSRIKFGNNCTPRLFDADGDGKNELVCGYLEYGLNVPIDNAYFPYRTQLQQQIDYIKDNNYYLGVHFYTNEHASAKREEYELKAHKAALSAYGVSTENVGVNQHTWYTSFNSHTQTFESAKNMGFLWNSGWQSSRSGAVPQTAYENVLGMPAYLDDEKKFLVFNTGSLLYLDDKVSDITAKYNLPLSVYYHCDFAYKNKESAENDVKHVDDYVKRNGMSFVREDELAYMASASVNTNVLCDFDDGKINLQAVTVNESLPLYKNEYTDCVGVIMDFAKGYNCRDFYHDAEVYYYDGNSVVLTMNKQISLSNIRRNAKEMPHIATVNVPCVIEREGNETVLTFDDRAYCEVKVFGNAHTNSEGWNVEYKDGYTVFKGFNKNTLSMEYQ